MRKKMKISLAVFVMIGMVAATAFAWDLHHNILPKKLIANASVSNNDNTDSSIIDRLGYGSVTFVIQTGTLADTDVTLTPEIHQCVAIDNCDTPTVATSLVGTIAGATFAATDDNTAKSIGYSGGSRFLRIRVTPANNTGAAPFSVIGILGHKQYGPAQ